MRFKSVIGALLLSSLPAAAASNGWYLVWNDEFDGKELDSTKWRVEDAALVKNNELECYSSENVWVSDGMLVLKSEARHAGGRDYASGLVDTKGKFSFQYGFVEIRAKLPRTQSLWPAHWMLPEDGSWPPEIDIMECIGSQPKVVSMSLHQGTWPDLESRTSSFTGPDFSRDFHQFGFEWEPKVARWYVDGKVRFAVTNGIPDIPFFIILNTAIGGDMPGAPDETTVLPQYHYIDYVRVYAREIPGTYFLTVGADHGRVTTSPQATRYSAGAVVTLSAFPSIGYQFGGWSGSVTATDEVIKVTMDAHKRIVANFVPDPNAPVLLSKGRPVMASSLESDKYRAQYAVDGDRSTRWSSQFSDPQWILVDLGDEHTINAVKLDWENAYPKSYAVDISDDGKTWRSLHATAHCKGGVDEIIGMNASGRYVRVTGLARATQWGYSLWEFGVYGK